MQVLILWADDQSPNLGVRVLGAGTEAIARRAWPQANIVFYNYGARTGPVRLGSMKDLGLEAVLRRRGLAAWFASFDVILDTRAGDSFADIYGIQRLAAMSTATEFAHQCGTRVVLTPQTIGPFKSRIATTLARRSLRTASLVMARDTSSAATANRLGRSVDIVSTDVVFALDQPQPSTTRDVVLNVSGLLWHRNPHVDAHVYRRVISEVYQSLTAAGRTVTLLTHVLDSSHLDNDVPAVEDFAREYAPKAEIFQPTSLPDVREMIAGASLVIGSRMHACLNALSVGTPAIPLAYSRKFAPLMADLGWSHVLDLRGQTEDVAAEIVRISSETDLKQAAERTRDRAARLLWSANSILSALGPASAE